MKTAILVDGGFFRKRASHLWKYTAPDELAQILQDYCWKHIRQSNDKHKGEPFDLYRIFYHRLIKKCFILCCKNK